MTKEMGNNPKQALFFIEQNKDICSLISLIINIFSKNYFLFCIFFYFIRYIVRGKLFSVRKQFWLQLNLWFWMIKNRILIFYQDVKKKFYIFPPLNMKNNNVFE